MSIHKRFALAAAVLLLCAGLLTAQQTTAKIFGTVQLEDGSLVPGVNVEATSPKLVGKATAVTDENGSFKLFNLTPGVYKLVFSLDGFQTVVRDNIPLVAEQTAALKVEMKLGNLNEVVTISGQVPLIDVKSTAKGMTLTKDHFQTLPKGRDFSSLVTAIPGVYNEPMTNGLSVDGASGAENVFFVDGMETGEIRGAQQRMQAAFDFIDEVQVKASGYQAEFGGSMGGVVNVVTRSGGNEFHGEVVGYYQGSALRGNTRDIPRLLPDDPTQWEYYDYEKYNKNTFNRIEGGFSLGGYIIKDKVWFFGSILPVYRKFARDINWNDEPGAARDRFERKDTWTNGTFKLTAEPAKNLRMSASFISNSNRSRGGLPGDDPATDDVDWAQLGSSTFNYGDVGENAPTWSVAGNVDYTLGNNLQVSARVGFYDQDNVQKLDPPGTYFRHWVYNEGGEAALGWPADKIHDDGWQNFTWGLFYKQNKAHYTRTSANVDLNYFMNLAGEHSWKAGFQYIQIMDDYDGLAPNPVILLRVGRPFPYQIDGSPVNAGYMGRYGYYENRSPFGTLVNKAKSNRYALYIQDSWTIANRLTLNVGLRAENEQVPAFSDLPEYKDVTVLDFGWGDKLAPRLGFIYDVFGNSSLKLFGSFGIFQDCMKLALPEGSFGGDRWISQYYELDTYDWEQIGVNGNFPGTYLGSLNWRIPSIKETDPDIKPMSQREISLGAEKKITDNLSFSARLVNKKLLQAIDDIGIQMPEGETYFIANPGSAYVEKQYQTAKDAGILPANLPPAQKAKRDYWAVNVALEKRFSNNWLGGFSYTWSRLTGNYAGLNSSDEASRNDPNVNRYFDLWMTAYDQTMKPIDGPLATDRPHYFKAYASYVFPWGLTLGGVVNAYSGVPFSTEIQVNGQQGYYPYNRFDTGKRSPFTVSADVYAEYRMKLGRNSLQLSLNIRNVTDAKTAQRIYGFYNRDDVYISDEDLISGQTDAKSLVEVLDPIFGNGYRFLPPLEATLGLKFAF
ncbi:MAG TPA: TonB-dependent receptor [Candidatus Aminicenantes bacterium]|nr:TonB-dependent receptor [Candidatus Aminicenantes bacterium]